MVHILYDKYHDIGQHTLIVNVSIKNYPQFPRNIKLIHIPIRVGFQFADLISAHYSYILNARKESTTSATSNTNTTHVRYGCLPNRDFRIQKKPHPADDPDPGAQLGRHTELLLFFILAKIFLAEFLSGKILLNPVLILKSSLFYITNFLCALCRKGFLYLDKNQERMSVLKLPFDCECRLKEQIPARNIANLIILFIGKYLSLQTEKSFYTNLEGVKLLSLYLVKLRFLKIRILVFV